MAFENAYESSIIFQPLLYANVPAESPSYAPTFFTNFLFESFTPNTGAGVMKFEQFMKFYLHIVTTYPVGLLCA